MNKKAKALISTIILISLICFIFLVLIKPSLSASEKFTVQFDIVPSIAHQTLYITITNNQDITDNLDLKTIINETNFNTQQIRNAQFYELKNVDYTITDYKTVCNPYNEVTANGTIEYPNCTQVVSGSHIETRQEWKQRQLTSNQAADKEVKHQWEQIAIGKTPNNIKKFKLEFDTPIVRNGAGWGSAGTIYLAMNGKAYVDKSHSSWWNESWTYRQKIIFNKVNWSSANLINFTTLILITNTTNGTSFNWSQRDAIRFIDANDSMELNHSVDNWNSTSQQAYIYVLVPEINNSGNDFIYLYYGNPTATNIEGNASVATNRYRFENNANDVYNLENWTEGTTPLYSTSNVKEGTHSINFSHNDTNALRHNTFFDNVNTKYGATGITFAAWYNFHNLTAANPSLFRWLFVQTDKLGQNYIMITSGDDTGAPLVDNKLFFHIGAGANGIMSIDVNTSIWYYLSLNWHPNGTAYVYRDGLLVNTSTVNTQIISDGTEWDNWIGRYAVDGRAADGQMDDLRFYGRALNADETNATYQSLENNFVTFGQEEFYDAEPPKWSNPKTNATNETKTQQSVYFNVTLNDNIGGGYQIFSFYNGTSWINDSAETWIAPQELEEKRTITATRGMVVKWYWWFNDSVGLFNQTPEWQFTVANTAPTQTKPLLTSTSGKNLNNDNLTCYNQSTYDADNDAVINIFNWYLNSQSFAVLNMPFETSAKDYSGYGNDGIIYGTTFEASKTIGKVGNALSFDGTDDYVSYTGSPLLKDMKNMSVSGWMYAKSVPTTGEGLFSSTNLAYGCTYYIDGRVWCYINGGGNNVVTPVAINEWHYITETYDGNTIRLYVDGVEKSTRAFNGSTGTSLEFRVGAFSGYFNGSIDEVRVYNRTLTPEQIVAHYNLEYNKIVAQETTPGETYKCEVTPTDGYNDGIINSSDELKVLWAIIFNVTDSYSGANLSGVIISCNYSEFDQAGDNTNLYGPYGFPPGSWKCSFRESYHFNKTIIFTANDSKVVPVPMSEQAEISIEEHAWLEGLYNCIIKGDCSLWNLLMNINQTTTKTWNQFKRTDQTIVTNETVTSYIVSDTSNLSIDYSVNVPTKEGYGVIEGIQGYDDFLPIRISYWFLNATTNKSCYNQGTEPEGVKAPYCNPLVAQTIGQINTQINFTVDLRPELPAGNYTIIRSIEIDPNNVWIDYGHEAIGRVEVLEDNDNSEINLAYRGALPSIIGDFGKENGEGSITGAAIKDLLSNKENLIFYMFSLIVGILVYLIIVISKLKKRVS